MLISVVMTTHAESRLPLVRESLKALGQQIYKRIETILVVDQDWRGLLTLRNDAGLARLEGFTVTLANGPAGASVARNTGINAARGDIVAFLDDDAIPLPNWSNALFQTFSSDSSIVGVTGPIDPLWEDPDGMSWFPDELLWVYGCTGWMGWPDMNNIGHMPTTNASYRRDALFASGGFRHDLGLKRGTWQKRLSRWREIGGEDGELTLRVRRISGGRTVFNSAARVLHWIPRSKFRLGTVAQRSWAIGRERRFLRHHFSPEELSAIYPASRALARIVGNLPRDLALCFRNPTRGFRRLATTFTSVSFGALGYLSFNLLKSE